jgi:hypothetical protein
MATPLSPKLDWLIANPLWAASLNPVIANPLNSISIIPNINLISGPNVINHKLGHAMNGWFLVDIQGIASIYRSAPFNNLTLTLTSNASVIVSIGVF